MAVTSLPVADEDLARGRKVQEALIDHLSGNRPIRVKMEPENGHDRPDRDVRA